jgi:hypothetical protein
VLRIRERVGSDRTAAGASLTTTGKTHRGKDSFGFPG